MASPVAARAQEGAGAAQRVVIHVLPVVRLTVASVAGGGDAARGRGDEWEDYAFYDLSTEVDHLKMTAALDRPLPADGRLLVRVNSRLGTSTGPVDLSRARSVDVVTGIGRGLDRRQRVYYSLRSLPQGHSAPTVTFTVTE